MRFGTGTTSAETDLGARVGASGLRRAQTGGTSTRSFAELQVVGVQQVVRQVAKVWGWSGSGNRGYGLGFR